MQALSALGRAQNGSIISVLRRSADCASSDLSRIVDHLDGMAGSGECYHRDRHGEAGILAAGGVPTDDRAMVQVTDHGQVELAATCRKFGDVGDPALVRAVGSEVASQQVGYPTGIGSASPSLPRGMRLDQVFQG
jgi:hypothetical protein